MISFWEIVQNWKILSLEWLLLPSGIEHMALFSNSLVFNYLLFFKIAFSFVFLFLFRTYTFDNYEVRTYTEKLLNYFWIGGVLTHSEVVLVDPEVENLVMRMPDKGNGFWPFKWFVKFIGRTSASFVLDGPEWEKYVNN